MKIKQFEIESLSHYSYAIISEGKMAVVDPQRNPLPYYQYAEENEAEIVVIFETHPHADFVSGHLQISEETGADIYISSKIEAKYPHKKFDDGDSFMMGEIKFSALYTPGHSPDSICIVAELDNEVVIFSGDTLFVGDVGRPDLREKEDDSSSKAEELAKMMYHTVQNKFTHLPDYSLIYPTHGAGSMCGKNISEAGYSTLGVERLQNWAFKTDSEQKFLDEMLNDQSYIPTYFKYNVELNNSGVGTFIDAVAETPLVINAFNFDSTDYKYVIDIRTEADFKSNHLKNCMNIQATEEWHKFETWLGSLVSPDDKFSIIIDAATSKNDIIERLARIGYEKNVEQIVTMPLEKAIQDKAFDFYQFKENTKDYTVLDIRNESEFKEEPYFEHAINIPLHELADNKTKIPTDKPVVVHCESGYRSAIGYSIILDIETTVYDLSDHIEDFK